MAKTRPIDPRDYVEPGTGFHSTLGYILFGLAILISGLISFGVAIAVELVGLIIYFLWVRVIIARIHGSALKLGPKQFPEIYDMVEEYSDAMDIDPPDIYILESNHQNALAAKIGSRKFVILFDDLVFASQHVEKPEILRFIIAHELAHHALGHTNLIRSLVSAGYKRLSRLDELSCDAVAAALVGEEAARDALSMLLVGPHLFAKTNRTALERQALEVEESRYTKRAERPMTHPLLLRRIARMIPDEDDGYADERPSKTKPKAKSNRYDDEDEFEGDRR
jgi:Zn-dependent protease with chaperone function